MTAIFTTEIEAKTFADKCHASLGKNCPNYNAKKWQDPTEYKEGWGVQVPQEYYKQSYPKAIEIAKATKVDFNISKEVIAKPESIQVIDKIIGK